MIRYLGTGHSAPRNLNSSGDHCNLRFRTFPVQVLPAKIVVVNRHVDSSELLPVLTCCLTKPTTCRMVRREQHMARQISMSTRKELVLSLRVRYRRCADPSCPASTRLVPIVLIIAVALYVFFWMRDGQAAEEPNEPAAP